jgi:hypothetical protein
MGGGVGCRGREWFNECVAEERDWGRETASVEGDDAAKEVTWCGIDNCQLIIVNCQLSIVN